MKKQLELQADRIENVLASHRVPARVTGGTVTPRWVRFNVLPTIGVKVSTIKNLHEEISAALDAPNCRVSRRGATLAVEIPRDDPHPVLLPFLLRQLQSERDGIPPMTAVLGLAEDGAPLLIRLPSPDVAHILVAGTTGSGKTVLLQGMILSLVLRHPDPAELSLVLIDPRDGRAFDAFTRLPHLARPPIRSVDEAVEVLGGLVRLMELRDRRRENTPPVTVFIDELADLLMTGDGVSEHLTRLIQRGRGAGIHVVAATQKPTAAVLGPLMKANFPVRLVGRVMSTEDARTASGWSGTGAERLTGRGDFLAVAEGRVVRFQAAYVTGDDIATMLAPLGWNVVAERMVQVFSAPSRPVILPPPPEPEPDEVEVMASRLQRAGWDPANSYRDACRTLGEAEGGGRFYLVQEAVDTLRATATATKDAGDSEPGPIALFGPVAVAG